MLRSAAMGWVAAAVLLSSGCSSDPGCADCCPPGEPTVQAKQLGCQVFLSDAGPAQGVSVHCLQSDGGAVIDSSGTFAFDDYQRTCGIAAGSMLCGQLRFIQDAGRLAVKVGDSNVPATEIDARHATGDGCRFTVQ